MELIDLLIEQKKESEKFFRSPMRYAKKIKSAAEKVFGEGKVEAYLFGSVVSGDESCSSDIDILIIAPPVAPDKRGEVLAALKKPVGMTSPFEIHLIAREKYENWYKKFIGKMAAV
ncbi:MAG: nucleotidyltransferase domain-containing protein [Endomicrobiia bacterium]|nr:nucleotidyltransferase domain-containing protein [Endomicrobiia bacterium]